MMSYFSHLSYDDFEPTGDGFRKEHGRINAARKMVPEPDTSAPLDDADQPDQPIRELSLHISSPLASPLASLCCKSQLDRESVAMCTER